VMVGTGISCVVGGGIAPAGNIATLSGRWSSCVITGSHVLDKCCTMMVGRRYCYGCMGLRPMGFRLHVGCIFAGNWFSQFEPGFRDQVSATFGDSVWSDQPHNASSAEHPARSTTPMAQPLRGNG